MGILDEYEDFLPLTLRQIFLPNGRPPRLPKNDLAADRLYELLGKARRARMIPFEAIRDDGAIQETGNWFSGPGQFWRAVKITAERYRCQPPGGPAAVPRNLGRGCRDGASDRAGGRALRSSVLSDLLKALLQVVGIHDRKHLNRCMQLGEEWLRHNGDKGCAFEVENGYAGADASIGKKYIASGLYFCLKP